MFQLTCFRDCIRAVFVPSVFFLNARGMLYSVFLFICVIVCLHFCRWNSKLSSYLATQGRWSEEETGR